MPTAHFVDKINNHDITRTFSTPKRLTQPEAWWRATCKVIPQIPKAGDGYYISKFDASLSHIHLTLAPYKGGHRCYVTINRRSLFLY